MLSTYENKRQKTEKPPRNPYKMTEVNQGYRDSGKGPLTLRPTAAYQLINTTKPDNPQNCS
jgi:hypothetical protein